MFLDMVRKHEHEAHDKLDAGDMPDFSVSRSDADGDETSQFRSSSMKTTQLTNIECQYSHHSKK